MSTLELKNLLISEINKTEDDSFLNYIKSLFDSKIETSKKVLENYNNDIQKSENDIKSGKIYSQIQVEEKISQWKKR